MTRTNTRSLDATTLRCLQIAVFTVFLLLFPQLQGNAQTVDCPLCPTNGARDTLPPHVKCYATVKGYLDSTGYKYISPLTPLSLLGDNCPYLTVWASQTRYYCRDTGTKNLIVFAQDSAGNIARCTTRVTIIDTLRSKVLNCTKDTLFRLSGGECTSPRFNFPTPSVSDNCSATLTMVQKSGLPSGSPFPSGISTVLFEATDPGGVKTTCSFKVTVSENVATAGSLLCVGSLDVGLGETCQTTLTARDLLAGTNLHCLADYKLAITYNSVVLANNTITSDYIGKILKAQITDLQTNNGCIATLTVRDLLPPRIAAPADTLVTCAQTDVSGSTPTSITGTARVIADCSPTTTSIYDISYNTPTCNGSFATAPVGFPTTVRFDTTKGKLANRLVLREFTVTDLSRNVSKVQQVIYIRKTDLAVVVCPPDITVQCSGNGINTLPDSALLNGVLVRGTGKPTFANGSAISGGGCSIGTAYQERRTNNTTGYTLVRTWIITNICTNSTRTCDQFISVVDNPPVIACKTNYTANIASITGIATVPALDVVASLTDACTPTANLMVRIQRLTGGMPWPDSLAVTFNCNDTGRTSVEILVKDETGMMSKCQTTIRINDPNSVCRAPTQPAIFGSIETEEGRAIVSNVRLQSATLPTVEQFTRASKFSFFGMPRGDDCDLTPSRDSDVINGVTTFDVALMSRHILDIQPIKSPLKLIAADVNADGSVDALDMVITRRMVLRLINLFPENKSWRFVPKVFQFLPTATTNPALNYPEFIAFVNLRDTVRTADFWAVKTGDLNGSATGPAIRGNGSQAELRGANPLILNINNELLEKDKTYDIDISSDALNADGFQFTLNYDKNLLKILSIEQGDLSNFNHTNYALFPSEGKATVSWNGSLDSKASPMNLFRLRLSAKQTVRLRDALRLTSDLTPAEAFSLAGDTRSVELRFKGVQSNDFDLFQNEPNPTINGATNIRFRLPEASDARLTLYDITGKMLKTELRNFEKGDNVWRINTPTVSGVILYRLETPTHSATRRMMIGE
jgi:hypothetical protein